MLVDVFCVQFLIYCVRILIAAIMAMILNIPSEILVIYLFLIEFPDKFDEDINYKLVFSFFCGVEKTKKNRNYSKKVKFQYCIPFSVPGTNIKSSDNYGDIRITGKWQRFFVSSDYDSLLAAAQINYFQRKIILSTNVCHQITLSSDLSVLRLQEQGNVLSTDRQFVLDGRITKTSVLGMREFEDSWYWDKGVIVLIRVPIPDRSFVVKITRQIADDGETLKMVTNLDSISTINFLSLNVFGLVWQLC